MNQTSIIHFFFFASDLELWQIICLKRSKNDLCHILAVLIALPKFESVNMKLTSSWLLNLQSQCNTIQHWRLLCHPWFACGGGYRERWRKQNWSSHIYTFVFSYLNVTVHFWPKFQALQIICTPGLSAMHSWCVGGVQWMCFSNLGRHFCGKQFQILILQRQNVHVHAPWIFS